jgi:hypothetical protein
LYLVRTFDIPGKLLRALMHYQLWKASKNPA